MRANPGLHLLEQAISPERVLLSAASSKEELLNVLVDQVSTAKAVTDTDALRLAIHAREDLMSTGIGLGVGVPHARIDSVRDLVAAVAVNRTILPDYESIDGGPVRLVFLVAARPDQQQTYIRLLAGISHVVKDHERRERILAATSPEELLGHILGDGHA